MTHHPSRLRRALWYLAGQVCGVLFFFGLVMAISESRPYTYAHKPIKAYWHADLAYASPELDAFRVEDGILEAFFVGRQERNEIHLRLLAPQGPATVFITQVDVSCGDWQQHVPMNKNVSTEEASTESNKYPERVDVTRMPQKFASNLHVTVEWQVDDHEGTTEFILEPVGWIRDYFGYFVRIIWDGIRKKPA